LKINKNKINDRDPDKENFLSAKKVNVFVRRM